jgi:uncharacterized repeat protein (TIGR03803 family)
MRKLLNCRLNKKSAGLCFTLLLSLCSVFSFAQNPTLYGMTYNGGAYEAGNIFKFTPVPMTYTSEINFTGASGADTGYEPFFTHLILAFDGNLYGMTTYGGYDDYGNIFKYNPNTNVYTDLIDFTGASGAYPGNNAYGSLMQATDSNLYGMTEEGGIYDIGNIFRYNPITGVFTDLVDFTGDTGSYLGESPYGNLIQAYDGNLYGMTCHGGANSYGVLFRYNITTNVYDTMLCFTGPIGSHIGRIPTGSLLQASDSTLYGMTEQGGPGFIGNLFSYNISTGTYTDLFNFTGTNGAYVGFGPEGSLIQAIDGDLYGMTLDGGIPTYGNIFRYNPDSGTYTNLLEFTNDTGAYPGGSPDGTLLQTSDGNLYGLTSQGGAYDYGVLFRYSITTNVYDTMFSFTGQFGDFSGQAPYGDLMQYTPTTTGTNEVGVKCEELRVYPNPSNGIFTIQSSVFSGQWSVEVYNVLGEQVYSQLSIANYQFSINISEKPNGVYLYRVLNEGGSLVGSGKVVIEK